MYFFPTTSAISTISRPLSSSMCSITPETANVRSSYNRMRGPGIGCWFSDSSNCSHWSLTLTFTLTSENLSLYTTHLLWLVLIQLCRPRCWHLDSIYCHTKCRQSQLWFVLSPLLSHPRLLGTFQSDIPHFTLTWPANHSPNQGWESTHRLHPWVVSFTPPSIEHWVGGTSILRLIIIAFPHISSCKRPI